MPTKQVTILGAGPAGLVAAHAAVLRGFRPIIYTARVEPSRLYGCQYLHDPIPGVPDIPHDNVSYKQIGASDAYLRKVYGADWDGSIPDRLGHEHFGWDIRETYNWLWREYSELIAPVGWIDFIWMRKYYDWLMSSNRLTLSTIPARDICASPDLHVFASKNIWGIGDAPEIGQHVQGYDDYIPPYLSTIITNGEASPTWYRAGRVFGYATVEWPGNLPWENLAINQPNIVSVEKPLWNNCNCWPGLIRAGRRGAWVRTELVYSVFQKVYAMLANGY